MFQTIDTLSLAFDGMSTNLVSYFIVRLHQGNATAAENVSNCSGTCYILPLFGAFLADAYWGRYWVIAIFSIIYVIVSLLQLPIFSPFIYMTDHLFTINQ